MMIAVLMAVNSLGTTYISESPAEIFPPSCRISKV